MTRTDIHRPSVINPDAYNFVGFRYDGPADLDRTCDDRFAIANHMATTKGRYSMHDHGGSCHVCGANAMYMGIFHHPDTNTYICVGEDCADKLDAGDWDAFRSTVKRTAQAAAGKQKAMNFLADHNLSEAWGIYDGAIDADDWKGIISSLVGALVRYGRLTDAQFALLQKRVQALPEAKIKAQAIAAAREAKAASAKHIGTIGERRQFDLTVKFTTEYDTQFGIMFVHVMEDADGNVVVYKGSKRMGEKGDSLSITATIKEHGERDGIAQTIISRPK